MNETPIRRLPQKKIHQTIDSMFEELVSNCGIARMRDRETLEGRMSFIDDMMRIRVLSEEILRWELL